MNFIIAGILGYVISVLVIGYLGPWVAAETTGLRRRDDRRDQALQDRLDRALRREESLKRTKELIQGDRFRVGEFTRFAFPIIRSASPALIASSIVSVQPMTAPIGGLAFYRPRYGSDPGTEELRTVLDDMIDALNEDDEREDTDPEWIAERIVREVFKTCPYSQYYRPDDNGPPVDPAAHVIRSKIRRSVPTRLVEMSPPELSAVLHPLLGVDQAVTALPPKWTPHPWGEPSAKLLDTLLGKTFFQ
ncbi:MAG: hypothetical protein AB7L09_02475 [Nitrospira sp.]